MMCEVRTDRGPHSSPAASDVPLDEVYDDATEVSMLWIRKGWCESHLCGALAPGSGSQSLARIVLRTSWRWELGCSVKGNMVTERNAESENQRY